MTAPLSEERRADIERIASVPISTDMNDVLRETFAEQWGNRADMRTLQGIIRELLSALDAEHRATLHAEVAADRLWQAFDDLQRTLPLPYQQRTREQIVGLVPLDTTREGE